MTYSAGILKNLVLHLFMCWDRVLLNGKYGRNGLLQHGWMEKFTSFPSTSMWMLTKMNGEMKPAAAPVMNAIIVFAAVVIICPWPNGAGHFDAPGLLMWA